MLLLVLMAALAAVALAACASRTPKTPAPPPPAGAKSGPPVAQGRAQAPLPQSEPQWRTTGEALGVNEPAREPVPLGEGASAFTPFSQDPANLRAEVAMICGSARANKVKDPLAPLVRDLYLSGVDPAVATEALLQADCASLPAVVREMIAQGGDESVSGVVGRALFLGGPGSEGIIETAASAGLERNLGLVSPAPSAAPGAPASGGSSLAYAMAYFPSQAESAGVRTAKTLSTLYSNATPGYGIYTFVLLGAGFDPKAEADQSRYAELLRVVETYVLAADQGTRGPSPESHAFLVAVQPDRGDAPLIEQTAPALSAPMRQELILYLNRQGQSALAQRLENSPGPFLVSSLEPRLMPTNRVSPRLIVDLSLVGAEYMYAVVDAYDQPVPPALSGRPESLGPVRERLLGLFNRSVPEQDLDPALKDAWVFRLGDRTGGGAGAPAVVPGPDAPATVPPVTGTGAGPATAPKPAADAAAATGRDRAAPPDPRPAQPLPMTATEPQIQQRVEPQGKPQTSKPSETMAP